MNSPNTDLGVLKDIARRAMLAHQLQPDFSAAATQQLAAITGPATANDASIRDLRALLWSSIDNDDSRDLDQIEVAEPLADGAVKIRVGIADVDALVKLGSAIDEHARSNTTTVYTVPQIFPMLPERLSTDLTSLAEGQERLAIVVEMTVQRDGSISASDIYRALVVNRAKLAYNSVGAWLEGHGPAPARIPQVPGMEQQLRIQDQVAQALRAVRHTHGALALQTIETRAVFDGSVLRDLQPDTQNRAKELIEDFMVAANGVVARFFAANGRSAMRRVLRTPKSWDKIVALASTLGEQLPAKPDAPALSQFLAKRQQADPARFPDLSRSVIKLLGRGEYTLERPGQDGEGHFGLAVSDYTHSTAPNRRFPDVIAQRLLKAALSKSPSPYDDATLQALATHCTEQEDNADKVARQVEKSAAAQLLSSRIGQRFDAVVTGAGDKGTWVRINSPSVEGKLVKGQNALSVGDHVQVRLTHTDIEHGFIDFERMG